MNAYWQSRTPRERVLLRAAAGGLVLALLWLLLLDPLRVAGNKAERALPELHRQTAEMRTLAAEARRLQAHAGLVAVSATDLEKSAGHFGLAPAITPQGEGRFAVRLQGVALTALLDWLGHVQRESHLFAWQASLRAAGEGRVEAQLVLAP